MNNIQVCQTEKGAVEYSLKGKGPMVLVVHGGHNSCRSDYCVEPLLENGFSVLIPSRPGYGATPISSGKTAAATAGLFAALLKQLNVEKTSVIGNSAGGPAALAFARLYPEMTEKLILEEAVIKLWYHRFTVQRYGIKVLFRPGNQQKFWDNQKKKLMKNERKTLLGIMKMFTLLKPEDVLDTMSKADMEKLKKSMITGNDSGTGFIYDVDHRAGPIEAIRCPTLIIHSLYDGNVKFSHAEYACKKIRNSELFVAPTQSHFIYFGPGSDKVLNKRLSFLQGR